MNLDTENSNRRPEAKIDIQAVSTLRSTSEPQTSVLDEPYAPGSAQLRRVRRFNKVAKLILNSPLHRVMSDKLMLITFTGRKTGRSYTTPVAYIQDADHLLIAAGGLWRKNLSEQPHVRVHLRGKSLKYYASIIMDAGDYERQIQRMATLNPTWAHYSGLELEANGLPTASGIIKARSRGLAMVQLVPETARTS